MTDQKATGLCAKCGKHGYLMRLHGDDGGPLMWPVCVGEWNAKYTRRRKLGRIAKVALQQFLDNAPSGAIEHRYRTDLIRAEVLLGILDGQDIGRLMGTGTNGETTELTAELLADVLQLTHPDRHPPERQELATRVTQELLLLQPFVLPKPKPQPTATRRDASNDVVRYDAKELLRHPPYPCKLCADTVPFFYCDPCKAEYGKRRAKELEAERAKRRAQYSHRKRRLNWRTPPKLCACGCGAEVDRSKRKDAKFCSAACRQRVHRQRAPLRTASISSSRQP
jgi:hypothetical protein